MRAAHAPTVSATSHGHLSASHCRQHSAARGRRDDVIAPRVRVRDVIALSHGSESEGCHCCSRAQTPSNADDYKNRRCHYDAVRGLSDE